jgi:hypothetical protein
MGLAAIAVLVVLGLHEDSASAQVGPPPSTTVVSSPSTSVPMTVPFSRVPPPTTTTLPVPDECTCEESIIGVLDLEELIEDVEDYFTAIADKIFTKPATDVATGTTRPPGDTTTSTSRPRVELCTAPPTTRPPVVTGAVGGAAAAAAGATACTAVDDENSEPPPLPLPEPQPVVIPVVSPPPPRVPVDVVPVPSVDPAVPQPVDEPPADDQPLPPAVPNPVLFVTVSLPAVPTVLPLPPQDPLPEVAFVDLVVPPPPVPSAPAVVRPAPVLRPLVVRGIGPGRPSALAGGRAEATGLDCPTGAVVTLRVEGRDVARTTADAAGMFQVELNLPSDLAAGRRLVSASCGPVTLEGPLQLVQTSSNSNPGAGVTTLAALLSLFLLIVLLLRTTQNDRRPVQ